MTIEEKEGLIGELEDLPPQLLQQVRDFIRFLKSQVTQEKLGTALLSETALKKDWLRPEEDEAWRDL